MIGPFAEAVRSTTQPCTFLLVVPSMVAVVATRARWRSLAAVLSAAIVGGWWFAANRFVVSGVWLRFSAIVVVAVLVVVVLAPRRSGPAWLVDERVQVAGAGTIAFVATQWWRPCVGEELGQILTDAQTGLAGQLPAMAAYMFGAMLPVTAIVLASETFEPPERVRTWFANGAALLGVVIAGALVLGRHDEVVVTLTRWTLA